MQIFLEGVAEDDDLDTTTGSISKIIEQARVTGQKCICFVTGVPGAGKTLVGLNIANQHMDKASELYSVFLSGNGPLVGILTEALARDRVQRSIEAGDRIKKGVAKSAVKTLIQNVHHFRDDCLQSKVAPIEHVVLFDEAQRAWSLEQTSSFMRQKKGVPDFEMSEPEFLISCMDRHEGWAVIICLVGGGQEINTGEAGISEWIESVNRSYPDWQVYISPQIHDSEYAAGEAIAMLRSHRDVSQRLIHLPANSIGRRRENRVVQSILNCCCDVPINRGRYRCAGGMMKVDGNVQALQNIGTMQQVAANNLANVSSDGFKASTVVQQGDRISISADARAAGLNAAGNPLSNSSVGKEMANMSVYGSSLTASVNVIRTRDEMEQALMALKK